MNPADFLLYVLTILIWGSTWIAIKFQLGDIDPLVAVILRFGLASLLLFVWCLLKRVRLRLSRREHAFILAQGLCMFGFNYWLVYWSEVYLTSAVVAVIFGSLVFLNMLNGRLLLKRPLNPRMVFGGMIGMCGIVLLFWPELDKTEVSSHALLGFACGFGATVLASFGNVIATRNASIGLTVISVNAWGMLYGTLVLTLIALLMGVEFRYPDGIAFSVSLLYLSVFGSVLAFGAYLRLLANIGPERAGYTALLIPVVALVISTFFEGYDWTPAAVLGLAMILGGNMLVMRRRPAARD